MTPPVLSALYGSTAIKMAANLSDANASALARNMATTAEFIATQPPFSFAAFVRGVTRTATTFAVPHMDFATLPQMTAEQSQALQAEMRRRYAFTATKPAAPASDENSSNDDPTQSSEWKP